jgi:hypothetical protein
VGAFAFGKDLPDALIRRSRIAEEGTASKTGIELPSTLTSNTSAHHRCFLTTSTFPIIPRLFDFSQHKCRFAAGHAFTSCGACLLDRSQARIRSMPVCPWMREANSWATITWRDFQGDGDPR